VRQGDLHAGRRKSRKAGYGGGHMTVQSFLISRERFYVLER
jgi:hypothetical protein